MTKLFPVPQAALTQHVIALGKTRSGKSSKMRVLVEGLLDQHKPVTIIDVKGDWWGLKSDADGKRPGYPIVIFGGKHADVPLNPKAGAAVAELIATGNRPCLLDLRGWMPHDKTRFFIDFASKVFEFTQGERYLVIPEIHNFAPKGKVLSPEAGQMLHWANRLASEGQGLGLILLADSQRPQKVHNDLLTSCETLIACRVIHKADRDAIKDWIDGCADPAIGKQMLGELAAMNRADAWCWSPEIGFGPEKITWPLFKTYDSFKPQEARTAKLKGWAEVDLEEVRAKLQAVVAEAEANDPKMLRKRIADLEQQLKAGGDGVPKQEVARLRAEAFDEARKQFEQTRAVDIKRACDVLRAVADELHGRAAHLERQAPSLTVPHVTIGEKYRPSPAEATPAVTAARAQTDRATPSNGHATDEPPSVRKILDVIHRSYPVSLSFDAAARRAGISSASSAYKKYRVLVHGSQEVEWIDGKYRSRPEHAGNAPMTSESGLALWIQKLPPSYGKMLEAIHQHGPVDKERIAELAGVSATSSGLGTGLRELQRLELISCNGDCYDIEEGLR